MRRYTPRRAGKRWLEGAPAYVLDVIDDKRTADRYTVLFTGDGMTYHTMPDKDGGLKCVEGPGDLSNTYIQYLGMSGAPSHPQGISMWGELKAYQAADYRYRNKHYRIKWMDLPEHIRKHVIARAEES